MVKQYQVTLMCSTGQYKPVSAIVSKDLSEVKTKGSKKVVQEIKQEGITKICNKRYWTTRELKKYCYTICKVREYDKSKDVGSKSSNKEERKKKE